MQESRWEDAYHFNVQVAKEDVDFPGRQEAENVINEHRRSAPTAATAPAPAALDPVAAHRVAAQSVETMIARSLADGGLKRVDYAAHEMLINPVAWAAVDADGKRNLTKGFAVYCDYRGEQRGLFYADIIDAQSGKKLAHYGPKGFEVF